MAHPSPASAEQSTRPVLHQRESGYQPEMTSPENSHCSLEVS